MGPPDMGPPNMGQPDMGQPYYAVRSMWARLRAFVSL